MGHWSGLMTASFGFIRSLSCETLSLTAEIKDGYSKYRSFKGNFSFKNTSAALLYPHPHHHHTFSPTSLFKDLWKQAKVCRWQQALVIKSFHWLISPYSSRTQSKQTRTDSPNDQRQSVRRLKHSLHLWDSHTHTSVPVGRSLPLSLTHTRGRAHSSSLVACGRFPCGSYSYVEVLHAHTGTHFKRTHTQIVCDSSMYVHSHTHTHTNNLL